MVAECQMPPPSPSVLSLFDRPLAVLLRRRIEKPCCILIERGTRRLRCMGRGENCMLLRTTSVRSFRCISRPAKHEKSIRGFAHTADSTCVLREGEGGPHHSYIPLPSPVRACGHYLPRSHPECRCEEEEEGEQKKKE